MAMPWQLWARQQERRRRGARRNESAADGTDTLSSRRGMARRHRLRRLAELSRRPERHLPARARNGTWSPEVKVSESPANDWEPAVAAGPDGTAYVAWDTYDHGNYDVCFRSWRGGTLSPLRRADRRARSFQAHASVAVDGAGRPWVAWDESGVNWGKDQGFLIPTPLATPLHRERSIRLAMWDGAAWQTPRRAAFPAWMRHNAEHPQIAFDGAGTLTMLFRHWTRRNDRTIGSPIDWENYRDPLRRREVDRAAAAARTAWAPSKRIRRWLATRDGEIRAAWMTDNRPFATQVPGNADVYCARAGRGRERPRWNADQLPAVRGAVRGSDPDPQQRSRRCESDARRTGYQPAASSIRSIAATCTGIPTCRRISNTTARCSKSTATRIDAAAFDYIAITDHQAGFDQEFTWWQNQKLVDLFQVAGVFTPLYAYERSLPYPNGHRNVIFAHRGVRTAADSAGRSVRARPARRNYIEYLQKNNGITMPHSSATDQGTDWRDNGGEVEPLIEIYQGYRTSYEYEGAPRAATAINPQAQKSGWQPEGFWWNALAKGYKLGVQSSSDHWSTHISYACLLAENFTREGLLDAIRSGTPMERRTTSCWISARSAGRREHIMGDAFRRRIAAVCACERSGRERSSRSTSSRTGSSSTPRGPARSRPGSSYTDQDFGAGESWYYVRVLQEDGQIAWSSPIWVKKQ